MLRPRPLLALMEWMFALRACRGHHGGASAGGYGEAIAALCLRRNGFRVVAMDWHYEFLDGDIDLIAWDGRTLCFLEVKTRGENAPFSGGTSVDRRKQEKVRKLAEAYVRCLPWQEDARREVHTRFDVVTVSLRGRRRPDVELLRGAF